MFGHNFKYSLKILFKNKGLLFWTFIFPILLGTLFNLAFSNIEKTETFTNINVAITQNNDSYIKSTFDALEKENVVNIKSGDLENSKKLFENKKVAGYIDNNTLYINSNGEEETILKSIMDEILINKDIYEEYLNNGKFPNNISTNYKITNVTRKNISYTMIEYYTLIAMAAFYGAAIALTMINYLLPNISTSGKRINISPAKRGTLLLSSFCASIVVQLIGMFILFLYTIFVLKVDYGDNLIYVFMLTFFGILASLSLGTFLASTIKTNSNNKFGILIAITMTLSFFSGMTGITMKYVTDKNMPIINYLNPCNMIVDGLYSLYYYGVNNRYYFNILSLIIFTIVMLLISSGSLRRQKYDSI